MTGSGLLDHQVRAMHTYVMQELARQRERELRKAADRYGLLGSSGWPRRRAGRRQNRGRIQLARICPASQPCAGDGGSGAV